MFCRNCAHQLSDRAVICPACGAEPRAGVGFCWNCRAETDPKAVICVTCGVALTGQAVPGAVGARSRTIAGILGILLGGFGVHRFYLGYTTIGIAQIAVTVLTFGVGALWGFVEGILILVGKMDRDAEGKLLSQ